MITTKQFTLFDELFDFYNKELFNGKLKECMIITNRSKKAAGTFCPFRWKNKLNEKENNIHEITLNPDGFDVSDEEWQQTLVHEMVHLWQRDFGKISRASYHNKQWADKMEEIGLMPSNTGKPGGKKTGQKMCDYIIPDGLFIKAYKKLKDKKLIYAQNPTFLEGVKTENNKAKSKTKYICSCGKKVWGKPDLLIKCLTCDSNFKQVNKDKEEL